MGTEVQQRLQSNLPQNDVLACDGPKYWMN